MFRPLQRDYIQVRSSVCDENLKLAGFKVIHQPETMFWGDRLAVTKDPYGNEWTVRCLPCALHACLDEHLRR
jgi:hypothetical protein